MLIDEQNIMLEARIQVRLKSQLHNDRIMVTVNMGIHSVQTLEELSNQGRECLWEGNTYTIKASADDLQGA